MAKGLKIALVLSLLLNVGLVVGFLGYRSYVGNQMKQAVATSARSETSLLRSVLADIESDDPGRIRSLKQKLRASIEMGDKAIEMMQEMAEK